jgi:stage IV sporulation protein A
MSNIYADIARRTGGDIYIGVVGPVRTGKSTLIKRVMEELVIPNIEDLYQRERAKDELPQSGSGKTIMTAEPKFVPEEAVKISPDGTAVLSVRMIDSVGYMVDGAIGATENGEPRMVTTPWADSEIPMTEAAEIGTKKVMEDHCSIGIVVTTDGTITDIPRADYIEAEGRAIGDMIATGKPFLVLINSANPNGSDAQALRDYIAQTYGVSAMAADCQAMDEEEMKQMLSQLLYAFPMREMQVFLPAWVQALEVDNALKLALYDSMRRHAGEIARLAEAESAIGNVCELEQVCGYHILSIDLGRGIVSCELEFNEGLFYQILSERTGFSVEDDGQLLGLLTELAHMKQEYDKISTALDEVRATGYGIVMPTAEEIHMEVPEIVKKGGAYGVKLRASASSIQMMRADIKTEISPMVGDEHQSEDLVKYLLGEYEGNTEKLWESNIFGKSIFELVNEGLSSKLKRMPEDARFKIKDALTKIINEGANGLICLLL